jgi:hypothetical protein
MTWEILTGGEHTEKEYCASMVEQAAEGMERNRDGGMDWWNAGAE